MGEVHKLLTEGANLNACDHRGWTPLHHAALMSNEKMMKLLLDFGADNTLRTDRGGTSQDIWNLTHLFPSLPHERIRLMKQEQGKQMQMTHDEFQKLTSAIFIEENYISKEQLWSEWDSSFLQEPFLLSQEYAQKYSEFVTNPPTHILSRVTKDARDRPLLLSPGLGLFAKDPIAKGEIIGEYLGNIQENPQENPYLLAKTCSLTHRNEIPFINDGFNNVVIVPIHNTRGLAIRYLFVAANQIARGEQFCWHYGLHVVKFDPYSELRPTEVREFIKSENIDELIRCIMVIATTREFSFEELVRAEKFLYILQTPAVQYAMILDGTINAAKAKKVLEASYCVEGMHQSAKVFEKLVDVAFECRKIKQRFSLFPKFAAVYDKYFTTLPSKEGVVVTLALARNTNTFLSDSLSTIEKDLKYSKKEELEECDRSFLNLWDEEIIPKNNLFIADFRKKNTTNLRAQKLQENLPMSESLEK